MSDKVEISRVALAALVFTAANYTRRNGYFASQSDYGRIEIASAIREGALPLGMSFRPQDDPPLQIIKTTPTEHA